MAFVDVFYGGDEGVRLGGVENGEFWVDGGVRCSHVGAGHDLDVVKYVRLGLRC